MHENWVTKLNQVWLHNTIVPFTQRVFKDEKIIIDTKINSYCDLLRSGLTYG